MKSRTYYRLLTIAGSDSGGGAGIQADLKTFAALGCYGMSVITALTAQNTIAVTAIHKIPADFVAYQIDAVLDDIGVDAVKIGMLYSIDIIHTVADRLYSRGISNIVVDPVMISKSGAKLLHDDTINTLRTSLLPLATIVTPNIQEASLLAEQQIKNRSAMEKAGTKILSFGPKAVLVKGGHNRDNICADCLCTTGKDGKVQVHWFEGKRIITENTHGTGCTLSSAIASHLAKGFMVKEAVKKSKKYIDKAIKAGSIYSLGEGHGPVHHFYAMWKK
jgi:hydroxymethylpyrimidine/phosphomethylpyrimidine kinase